MREKRRDAVANRQILLETAAAAFREHGINVALDVIAARSGVGIGTLYRHFPSRGDLVLAILNQRLDSYAAFVHEHPGGPGLVSEFLQFILEGIALYAVAFQFIHHERDGGGPFEAVFSRFEEVVTTLVGRARAEQVIAGWVSPTTILIAGRMLVGLFSDARAAQTEPDVGTAMQILIEGLSPR